MIGYLDFVRAASRGSARIRIEAFPSGSDYDDRRTKHRHRERSGDAERLPIDVRRFRTGTQHYVLEATFADRPPSFAHCCGAQPGGDGRGSQALTPLQPRGVPLPEIVGEGVNHRFSHLVIERLPGSDLGAVIGGLADATLEAIATKVARAQSVTSETVSGARYGYGIEPADAPREMWSQVVLDNVARSRRRIARQTL
jgi:hypothetical protein